MSWNTRQNVTPDKTVQPSFIRFSAQAACCSKGASVGSASCQVIDALAYELYGLTEEEIAIVEGRDHSTSSSTDYSERGFSDHSALGHGMVVSTDVGPMGQMG